MLLTGTRNGDNRSPLVDKVAGHLRKTPAEGTMFPSRLVDSLISSPTIGQPKFDVLYQGVVAARRIPVS